jgi:hypothetical protein
MDWKRVYVDFRFASLASFSERSDRRFDSPALLRALALLTLAVASENVVATVREEEVANTACETPLKNKEKKYEDDPFSSVPWRRRYPGFLGKRDGGSGRRRRNRPRSSPRRYRIGGGRTRTPIRPARRLRPRSKA